MPKNNKKTKRLASTLIQPKKNTLLVNAHAYGYSLLTLAARKGNQNAIERLIKKNQDVNAYDKNGYTPLLVAAELFNLPLFLYLVDQAGANINIAHRSYEHVTIFYLFLANNKIALQDKVAAISLLLKKKYICTVWDKVASLEPIETEIPLLLLKFYGADFLNVKDENDETALNRCVYLATSDQSNLSVKKKCRWLLEHKADPNLKNEKTRSPLVEAIIGNQASLMRLLISYGAIFTKTDFFNLVINGGMKR